MHDEKQLITKVKYLTCFTFQKSIAFAISCFRFPFLHSLICKLYHGHLCNNINQRCLHTQNKQRPPVGGLLSCLCLYVKLQHNAADYIAGNGLAVYTNGGYAAVVLAAAFKAGVKLFARGAFRPFPYALLSNRAWCNLVHIGRSALYFGKAEFKLALVYPVL